MTYDLTIGERYTETDEMDGKIVTLTGARDLELPDAPALPGAIVSKHTNLISIPWFGNGYEAFQEALCAGSKWVARQLCTGTNDWETVPITPALLEGIDKALNRFQQTNPQAQPRFRDNDPSRAAADDATLARLVILSWWAHYAAKTFGEAAVIHIH